MDFPNFFDEAPTITLHDPLAAFLGVSKSGIITYSYADAVKLAGHSCPTVAGAYLMMRSGLTRLYGDELPERGGMEVFLREPREQGTTGVIAAIATFLTGAAPETGFGGIGTHRRFARRDLLHFDAPIEGLLGLRRRDSGRDAVLAAGRADEDEQARFATLWQARVAQMLVRHADDPDLVQAREWKVAA